MATYNISAFQNATNVGELVGVVSWHTGHTLGIAILVTLWVLIIYQIMRTEKYTFWQASSYASFTTFIISIMGAVWQYDGTSLIPVWFVVLNLVTLGVSIAMAYTSNN